VSTKRATGGGRSPAAPRPRSWQERLDDPDEPLFTVGVVADLLDTDAQSVRRLEEAAAQLSARPSGNQRRYSRRDVQVLSAAQQMSRDGMSSSSIARILELERQVDELQAGRSR
jgi:DNA-binding transcriptional MerR regulator